MSEPIYPKVKAIPITSLPDIDLGVYAEVKPWEWGVDVDPGSENPFSLRAPPCALSPAYLIDEKIWQLFAYAIHYEQKARNWWPYGDIVNNTELSGIRVQCLAWDISFIVPPEFSNPVLVGGIVSSHEVYSAEIIPPTSIVQKQNPLFLVPDPEYLRWEWSNWSAHERGEECWSHWELDLGLYWYSCDPIRHISIIPALSALGLLGMLAMGYVGGNQ